MASPAPIRLAPSDTQAWRDALEAMKPTTSPCPGITGPRWEKTRESAIAFLDEFGDQAAVLGWTTAELFGVHPMAGFIRVCLGSATVAGLTAAGVMLPVLAHSPGTNPNLLVLAIGAGSLLFSHVNDGGFWLFKEYFGLSVKDTFRSWSIMETIVSVVGLLGVLVLDWALRLAG